MNEEKGRFRCPVWEVLKRFRPSLDHLAAAHREVLLAVKSAIETQVEIIDEWRNKHTRPQKVG